MIFLVNLHCYNAEINCASGQSIQIVTPDDAFHLELNTLKPGLQAKDEHGISVVSPCKTATSQALDVFSTIFAAMKVRDVQAKTNSCQRIASDDSWEEHLLISFQQKANTHNDQLYNEIIGNFEKDVVQARSDLKADDEFNKLFDKLKQESLDEV